MNEIVTTRRDVAIKSSTTRKRFDVLPNPTQQYPTQQYQKMKNMCLSGTNSSHLKSKRSENSSFRTITTWSQISSTPIMSQMGGKSAAIQCGIGRPLLGHGMENHTQRGFIMATPALSETPLPFPANTLTYPSEWLKCAVCFEEYTRLVSGKCPRCADSEKWKAEREAKERGRLISMLGVRGYEQFTFERFRVNDKNRAAFEACRSFDPSNGSLYLWGPVGSGKSHLSGAIVRAVPCGELYKSTAVIRWFRLRDPREEEREIERLAAVPCLVVDDLGVQKDSEHALGVLYEIFDRRDMDMRHGLVITSNLPLDELAAKMHDDRITSRIAGMCRVVKLDGNDGRMAR